MYSTCAKFQGLHKKTAWTLIGRFTIWGDTFELWTSLYVQLAAAVAVCARLIGARKAKPTVLCTIKTSAVMRGFRRNENFSATEQPTESALELRLQVRIYTVQKMPLSSMNAFLIKISYTASVQKWAIFVGLFLILRGRMYIPSKLTDRFSSNDKKRS